MNSAGPALSSFQLLQRMFLQCCGFGPVCYCFDFYAGVPFAVPFVSTYAVLFVVTYVHVMLYSFFIPYVSVV